MLEYVIDSQPATKGLPNRVTYLSENIVPPKIRDFENSKKFLVAERCFHAEPACVSRNFFHPTETDKKFGFGVEDKILALRKVARCARGALGSVWASPWGKEL